ncbi:LuxR C-terminal-related transcriptional regulator [Bradyrhizobium erythrophlei]|uniref:LuxR family transcriptional regulator, maltose regulon positive regulatory protein n=1 Tax=Bradyrhizobium erythrophlei TaxID=1437360 RepID=A0A1M7TKL8_9BRAD|nr:LuxR C-terminal-related transcriptional regulator [Bradyrhizobium erythrophlei]SHN71272.1 LuxR family transcriptional regulator, maltose regulon positive regulatory protein [Bradyrhizobium erythrophlei]
MIEPSSSHNAIGAGISAFASAGRLPFLATKIVPARLGGLVARPRLLAMLSGLPAKQLGVIKAPAGFGKTSLAAAWAEQLEQNGCAVAWLTIDSDDDEATRFLFYLSQAVHRACPDVGASAIELILENNLIDPPAVLSSLINDLTEVEEDVYFFFEDYHWLSAARIHQTVAYFLKHAPSHCHVVLTTRTEPPLPLATLRAQNQLIEIDAAALRFDMQETVAFLDRARPGVLELPEVLLLQRKTEGWPAALRIIVSMASQSGPDLKEYVHSLSGSQRPIAAYLSEMLDALPAELVDFLLRTAILDRLSGPLCEAVTGASTSRTILTALSQRQMLLTPLGNDGVWHRCHTLLAEYLRQRLEADADIDIPELHRRASLWHASQELWTEAVQHAIAAGDSDRAIGWIKNCAMALITRGDLFTLLEWRRLFPGELMRSQPEVRMAIAWGLALALRFEEALQLATEIQQDVDANDPRQSDLLSECRAIRALTIGLMDDTERALPLAQDCVNNSSDPWAANVASNVVRYCHMKAGDLKQFYATPWIPYSIEEDHRNAFASVYRRCLQGLAEERQIRLAAADAQYREGLRIAEQGVGPNSVAAALPASLIARIRYEDGQIDEAESWIIDRVPLIISGTMHECVLSAYFVLARVAAARMNFDRTRTILEQAENQGVARGWGRLSASAIAEQARLHLNDGRIDEAAACVDRLERLARKYAAVRPCAWSEIEWYHKLARAHLLGQQDRPDDAISILQVLQHDTEAAQHRYFLIRSAIHLSAVQLKAGKTAEAVNRFRRVLTACASAGLYQTVLDEGPIIDQILQATQVNRNIGADLMSYVDRLMGGVERAQQDRLAPASRPQLLGALSPRETDILQLIAHGLSNKEVARRLDIGPETVKSHLKSVFTKLGVERRSQAVARAQTLGLVITE